MRKELSAEKITVTFEGKWKLTPCLFFILCPGLGLSSFLASVIFFFILSFLECPVTMVHQNSVLSLKDLCE